MVDGKVHGTAFGMVVAGLHDEHDGPLSVREDLGVLAQRLRRLGDGRRMLHTSHLTTCLRHDYE